MSYYFNSKRGMVVFLFISFLVDVHHMFPVLTTLTKEPWNITLERFT